MKFPTLPFGSLCEMIAVTPIPSARPAIACVRLRIRPKSTNTAKAVRTGTSPLGVTRSSTKEPAAKTTPTVAGAPKGKRRRAKSGTVLPRANRTSNQSGPLGPSFVPRETTTQAISRPSAATISASNQ